LDGARNEARGIRTIFPSIRLFAGRSATKETVLAVCGDADLLHFGVHGKFDETDPSASALMLTPSPSNASGRLSIRDIRQLRLAVLCLFLRSTTENDRRERIIMNDLKHVELLFTGVCAFLPAPEWNRPPVDEVTFIMSDLPEARRSQNEVDSEEMDDGTVVKK